MNIAFCITERFLVQLHLLVHNVQISPLIDWIVGWVAGWGGGSTELGVDKLAICFFFYYQNATIVTFVFAVMYSIEFSFISMMGNHLRMGGGEVKREPNSDKQQHVLYLSPLTTIHNDISSKFLPVIYIHPTHRFLHFVGRPCGSCRVSAENDRQCPKSGFPSATIKCA